MLDHLTLLAEGAELGALLPAPGFPVQPLVGIQADQPAVPVAGEATITQRAGSTLPGRELERLEGDAFAVHGLEAGVHQVGGNLPARATAAALVEVDVEVFLDEAAGIRAPWRPGQEPDARP